MNLLQRNILYSITGASIGGVGLFVFILITGNAMRDILGLLADGRITLTIFLELLALLAPYAVSFAMPLGMLIGILLVMGRMSANREIIAIRAAGISLWSVSVPVILLATLGTMLASWINVWHAPAARGTYRAILDDIVRTDPLRFIIPKTFIHEFPGYVIYVGEKHEDRLRHFWLWELDDQRRAVRLLRAEEGSFDYDAGQDALILSLRNGFTELRDAQDPDNLQRIQPTLSFRDARIRLPLDRILGDTPRPRRISTLTLPELLERRDTMRSLVLAEPPPDATDPPLSHATGSDIDAAFTEQIRTQYHLSRHLAMAFSVFSLAMLGIPLGIQASRSETYANIAIALSIAMVYYLLMIIIGWAEEKPALRPDILIWLPNFACQSAGLALLVRANSGHR